MNMNSLTVRDKDMEQDIKRLDAVDWEAVLTTMRAMVEGFSHEDAFAAGNAVLIKAGRKPVPYPLTARYEPSNISPKLEAQ